MGLLALSLDFKRRKIALENMRRCLPELGEHGWRSLLRENYAHYGILTLELLHFFSPVPGHYRAYIRRVSSFHGLDRWKKIHARGRGVIVVTGHFANWEAMAGSGAMLGIPMTMVTRRLKPDWLHKKMEAQRHSVNLKLAYPPSTVPTLMKALRKGQSVGFAIDQYAHPPMGVAVEFFGTRVFTLAAVAPLAARTGAGILFCHQERDAAGIIHILVSPEIELGPDIEDTEKATQALTKHLEDLIRSNPTQWLWAHRRFKNLSEAAAA